ncbi:MAG: hypothetical protein WAL37_06505 [Xanthobacteraceae bacterium]
MTHIAARAADAKTRDDILRLKRSWLSLARCLALLPPQSNFNRPANGSFTPVNGKHGNCRPGMYARWELDYDAPMLMVTIWNQITTEFYSRPVYGSYVIENETITVKTARGQKGAQLGGSKPHQLAERLLRELAAEGKA